MEGKGGCNQREECWALRPLIQNSLGQVKELSRSKAWEAKVLYGNPQRQPRHREIQDCKFGGIHVQVEWWSSLECRIIRDLY